MSFGQSGLQKKKKTFSEKNKHEGQGRKGAINDVGLARV